MTEISRTSVQRRTAWRKSSTAKLPSASRKASTFNEARLHAVSSRNMYSEHGFDALIRPLSEQVFHSLIVLSNWRPGSAEAQAACALRSHNSLAGRVFDTLRSVRRTRCQSAPDWTFSRKSLVSRTELFEFCPATV